MRAENGPPLPLAGHLRRPAELQTFSSISVLHLGLLLDLLCGHYQMVVAGGF